MDVYELSQVFVERFAALAPSQATFFGIAGHDHAWDDFGPEGHASRQALFREYHRLLGQLEPTAARWPRLAARALGEYLGHRLEAYEQDEHLLDLNNIESTLQVLRRVFDSMDTKSRRGWENVVSRLESIDRAAAGYRATLEQALGSSKTVARRQVQAAVEQAAACAGESSFFLTLPGGLDAAGVGDSRLRERLVAGTERARRTFAELGGWLERAYLPAATERDAVGRERYLGAIARHLGAVIDPLETYAWGWSQVGEIERAMRETAARIAPGKSVTEVVALLESDPSRCARDASDFVRIISERQSRALAQLDGRHFDVPEPIRRVEVRIAPPGGALGAYYLPPSEDFSRPGTVWYSPGERQAMPLWSEITTAYHEGFPGHHLQCGIQVCLADKLSRPQRSVIWYPGSGEGWALYAESLMHELGYLELPEYVLGMLAAQMLRACRVVIDIGSHLELAIPGDESGFHPGEPWSFEVAVEMLVKRAFVPADHAASEVTRYLGWPGQAISYLVGQREILRLRDEMRRRQGPGFELKEFHRRVLECGSVGLALLAETVLGED